MQSINENLISTNTKRNGDLKIKNNKFPMVYQHPNIWNQEKETLNKQNIIEMAYNYINKKKYQNAQNITHKTNSQINNLTNN